MSCGLQLIQNRKERLSKFIEVTRCLEKGHLKHVYLNKKTWALILALMQKKVRRDYKIIFLFELSVPKCKSRSHCLDRRQCSVAVKIEWFKKKHNQAL